MAIAAAVVLARRDRPAPPPQARPATQDATLVAVRRADDPSQQADSLTIFGVGRGARTPVGIALPTATEVVIPGHGEGAAGKALAFGRPSLVETTVANLLGVAFDRTLVVDDVALAEAIDAIGGVPIGTRRAGGAEAAGLLTGRGEQETELAKIDRARTTWDALATAAAEDRARAADALGTAFGDRPGGDALARALAALGRTATDARPWAVVPVARAAGPDGAESYRIAPDAAAAFARARLAGSLLEPRPWVGARVRLEGPEGPEAEREGAALVAAGFRIVASAAVDGKRSTAACVLGDDARARAVGDRLRALLGIAEVSACPAANVGRIDAVVTVGGEG